VWSRVSGLPTDLRQRRVGRARKVAVNCMRKSCRVLLDLFVGTCKKMFKVVIVKLEVMEGEWDHVSFERICMMLGFENSRRNNK